MFLVLQFTLALKRKNEYRNYHILRSHDRSGCFVCIVLPHFEKEDLTLTLTKRIGVGACVNFWL